MATKITWRSRLFINSRWRSRWWCADVGPPGEPATAGGAGLDVSSDYPGAPNSGVYAGGGGGSGQDSGKGGSGGTGGGGAGGANSAGTAGTANTGGGAGAGGGCNPAKDGANGGSGIVIVKELNKASGVWSMQSQFSARSQGTWPQRLLGEVDYLLIAGGGAGGGAQASNAYAGGGAGGYIESYCTPGTPAIQVYSPVITVTVGGGGTAVTPFSAGNTNGENSVIVNKCTTLTAIGGGRGGGNTYPYPVPGPNAESGQPGGSGGGS